jgi:AcrR family transcriptional regulator
MMAVNARERILETATKLFYRDGIHRVGIDYVIAESGVAKMSLYRHFGSKEELVLAFLDRINTEWFSWLKKRVSSARAAQRPLVVFDALGEWFKTPTFRGCPFVSSAAEFRDPADPVHQAAWQFKKGLRDYFQLLLREAGRSDHVALADAFLLLADGAMVRAAMEGKPDSAKVARRAAAVLLGHEP